MATKKTTVKKLQKTQLVVEPVTPIVVKKIQTKKPAAKKRPAKRKITKAILVDEITLGKNEKLNLPMEVSQEFVVVHRCQNCEHMPVSVGKLVTLFSVLIFLLSFSILVQIGQINVNSALARITQSVAAASLSK